MKKRYMFTLDKENVERYRELCRELLMPPAQTISMAIDDFIRSMIPMMEHAAKTGKISVVDFFTYLGEQVQAVQNNEREVSANVQQIGTAKKKQRSGN